MGSDGLDGTSDSKDGKSGSATIDFSAGENSKLVIQGMKKLTLNGGNGGDGLDGANGGDGGDSYETAIEADTVIGSYNELGGTAGAYGEKGTAGKGNGNNFWSAIEDRYGSAGKNGTAGTLLP